MPDYAEIICEAVDTLVSKKLESVNFDTTIVCEVVNTNEAQKYKYQVSNGSAKFIAYSQNTDYKVGDNVYVTIPNGDYSQEKIIIGKQVANNTTPFVFKRPFETIIDISGNLISGDLETKGLIANLPEHYPDGNPEWTNKIKLWSWEALNSENKLFNFTRLGLSAQFQSLLDDFQTVKGDYGLELLITSEKEISQQEENVDKNSVRDNIILTKLALTSNDMYGNPYDFQSFYSQELVFDISSLNTITALELWYYERPKTFINKQGKPIPFADEFGEVFLNNLFVKDPYVCVGYDLASFDKESFILYSPNTPTYAPSAITNDPKNHKSILLRWIHNYDDGIGEGTANTLGPTDWINWYRYSFGAPSADEYSGVYWKYANEDLAKAIEKLNSGDYTDIIDLNNLKGELNKKEENLNIKEDDYNKEIDNYKTAKNTYEKIDNPTETDTAIFKSAEKKYNDAKTAYNEAWSQFVEQRTAFNELLAQKKAEIFQGNNEKSFTTFEYNFDPDTSLEEERFKVIAFIGGRIYRSNIIVFNNEKEVENRTTIEALSKLTIYPEDESYGNYFIYQLGGSLIDSAEANKLRDLSLYFALTPEDMPSKVDNVQSIEWKIPLQNSMFSIPEEENKRIVAGEPAITWTVSEQEGFLYIKHDYTITSEDNHFDEQNLILQYYIKPFYAPMYNNNTIECSIKMEDQTYFASKTLNFGYAGTSGTDVTLRLDFENGYNGLVLGEQNQDEQPMAKKVIAHLYDSTNKEVDLSQFSKEDLTWSWYSTTTDHSLEIGESQGNKIWKNNDSRYITMTQDSQNPYIVSLSLNPGVTTIPDNYYILQLTLTGWGNYPLKAFLPIPIYKERQGYLVGPVEVRYDSEGKPFYYRTPYDFYWSENGKLTKEEDVDWRIDFDIAGGPSGTTETEYLTWLGKQKSENQPYLPSITEFKEDNINKSYLQPLNFYIDDLTKQICLNGYNKKGEKIVSYPLFIYQNIYPAAMLNEWDGKLKIDDDNGTIMATSITAGKKNSDNTFSGVVIGDIGKTNKADSESALTEQSGVYGYHHGGMSYAFKEDGTAFIGKSGKGRINFDGNNSTISSEAYETTKNTETPKGMLIDLDDSKIKMLGTLEWTEKENKYEGPSSITLDATKGNSLFNISVPRLNENNINSISIINIGDNNYYLQSSNFNTANQTGTKIDLAKGKLIGYDFNLSLTKSDTSQKIIINSNAETTPFKVGNKFSINWDGTLYANGGYFKGQIDADSGTLNNLDVIGELEGGTIYGSTIYANNFYAKGININDEAYGYDAETGEKIKTSVQGWIGYGKGATTGGQLTTVLQMYSSTNGIVIQSNSQVRLTAESIFLQPHWTSDSTSNGGLSVRYYNNNFHLAVTNISAENQSGIYARFA